MNEQGVREEPTTERSGPGEGVTTLGSPGIAQLHHLRALCAALEPARAYYSATAVEQLRSLPTGVRREVFGQVLSEHPALAFEPAVQALADELGIPRSAMTGTATTAAYARMEVILPVLANGLCVLEKARTDLVRDLGQESAGAGALPRTARELLAWLLDERVEPAVRAVELAQRLRALATHGRALRAAASEAVRALLAEADPEAALARTNAPRWWPRIYRDAVVLSGLRALHDQTVDGQTYFEAVHRARFAAAYASLTSGGR